MGMSSSPCQDICPDSSMECCAVETQQRASCLQLALTPTLIHYNSKWKTIAGGEIFRRAMLHSCCTGCLPSAEVLLCHCEKSVDLIIDNKMCVRGLYSAELAWSDIFCESPTSTELEQKSHSHIWQRERQHDTAASRVDGWFIILNCEVGIKKLIMRTDFTFQVAASERHKAGGDEVVHVLASAAYVFLPIVTWWDGKRSGILISDITVTRRGRLSRTIMTIFYSCRHFICN